VLWEVDKRGRKILPLERGVGHSTRANHETFPTAKWGGREKKPVDKIGPWGKVINNDNDEPDPTNLCSERG